MYGADTLVAISEGYWPVVAHLMLLVILVPALQRTRVVRERLRHL